MSLNKYQLVFDPAEPVADCDTVGSYLLSDDGTALTHTTLGTKEALDVNIAGGDLNIDVDIRDLDANQDNVAISDGTNSLAINGDGSINAQFSESPLDTCAYGATNVTTTVTDLITTDTASRVKLAIQNLGNKSIFVGCDNSVTTSNGIEVPKGAYLELPFGGGINVHAITASGTADVRYVELAA